MYGGAPSVLILGGTTEASALARALSEKKRFRAILSLAGRTRAPVLPPVACRVGGFGGVPGLIAYLGAEQIAALIDATHPFAAQMTRHAVLAAEIAAVPVLRIERSPWRAEAGDRWIDVPDIPAAAGALGQSPRRVFLTIGQQELSPFRSVPQHDYLIRSVEPPAPEALPPRATVITARGPFAEADEVRLMTARRVEVLVTKNSGGTATEAKLHAARRLGLPVVMVARPPAVEAATVPDVAAALAWLHAVLPRGV